MTETPIEELSSATGAEQRPPRGAHRAGVGGFPSVAEQTSQLADELTAAAMAMCEDEVSCGPLRELIGCVAKANRLAGLLIGAGTP